MKLNIRGETKNDYENITCVNDLAFGQRNEAKLVELLRQNTKFIQELSIVAIHGQQIAGHILFFPVNIIHETIIYESLSLGPMSVIPEFQKQGIGGKLIIHGLNVARELGFKSVIVLGHSNYYPKFGFKKASYWEIRCPFEVPDEVFMAIELKEGGLDRIKGMVEYPVEFDEVS